MENKDITIFGVAKKTEGLIDAYVLLQKHLSKTTDIRGMMNVMDELQQMINQYRTQMEKYEKNM